MIYGFDGGAWRVQTWIGSNADGERVAAEASGATADGHVVARLAVGVRAARSRARVDAVAVAARQVAEALGVIEALGSTADTQRVPGVARRTRAHGPSAQRLLAVCVHAARIPGASLTLFMRGWVIVTLSIERNQSAIAFDSLPKCANHSVRGVISLILSYLRMSDT